MNVFCVFQNVETHNILEKIFDSRVKAEKYIEDQEEYGEGLFIVGNEVN